MSEARLQGVEPIASMISEEQRRRSTDTEYKQYKNNGFFLKFRITYHGCRRVSSVGHRYILGDHLEIPPIVWVSHSGLTLLRYDQYIFSYRSRDVKISRWVNERTRHLWPSQRESYTKGRYHR